jgi:chromosome segregation ATPase
LKRCGDDARAVIKDALTRVAQLEKSVVRFEHEVVPDYVARLEALDRERYEAEARAAELEERLKAAKANAKAWSDSSERAMKDAAAAEQALEGLLDSMGVDLDDARLDYVVVQLDRHALTKARAALAGAQRQDFSKSRQVMGATPPDAYERERQDQATRPDPTA